MPGWGEDTMEDLTQHGAGEVTYVILTDSEKIQKKLGGEGRVEHKTHPYPVHSGVAVEDAVIALAAAWEIDYGAGHFAILP